MRILALGMGGAGCRIAEALYANDRKSSKVTCVQALAIDVDSEALAKLKALPDQAKIDFSALEPGIPGEMPGADPAAVDIGEVLARIQNMEHGETDAILVCCGLGGRMADAVPRLVAALRESVTEPIFGLVTLPALSEGERRAAKAGDDIDAISPLLDGIILFDNETWLKKIAARRDALVEELSKGPGLFGLGRNSPKLTPKEITDKLLNQSIIRRISLLLRAGEFRADGGIDLAEVVLDSSEVLNTIRGMGFISVGYAVENISQGPLAFFARLRGTDSAQEQRRSAERIIELAKQAIYQEVSVPCDMTSAAKALILVAGPSHEISMKGFMTVRKWLDRSIAGMEMRSGDYPVTNSENVAIIVVLSGLENIPRITELREIRDQSRAGISRPASHSLNLPPAGGDLWKTGGASAITTVWSGAEIQDEMITFPGERSSKGSVHRHYEEEEERALTQTPSRTSSSSPAENLRHESVRPRIQEENLPKERLLHSPAPVRSDRSIDPVASRRILPGTPSGKSEQMGSPSVQRFGQGATSSGHEPARPSAKRTLESGYEGSLPLRPSPVQRRTPVPQISHQDLQKPAQPVLPERRDIASPQRDSRPSDTRAIVRKVVAKSPTHNTGSPREGGEQVQPEQPHKMIIRHKKKEPLPEEGPERPLEYIDNTGLVRQEELEPVLGEDHISTSTPSEETKIGIRDRPQPARDDIFLGKAIPTKAPLRAKDAALLQAELKPRKIRFVTDEENNTGESGQTSPSAFQKKGRLSPDDDRT
jgi:cell division GTPase FtsZ